MIHGSKHALYHALRAQGLRLYAPRLKLLSSSSCVVNFKRNMVDEDRNKVGFRFWELFREKLGHKSELMFYKSTLRYAGFRLYLSASEASLYNRITDYIELPDTMASWHKLTTLHVWLILSRLVMEGKEGKIVRNSCIKTFYVDTHEQARRIEDLLKARIDKDDILMLNQSLWVSLLMYDEGLLGSDKQLACALWRCLFAARVDVDPIQLETMVLYVRKQVAYLQRIPSESLLSNGLIPFLPVEGNRVVQTAYDRLEKVKKLIIIPSA